MVAEFGDRFKDYKASSINSMALALFVITIVVLSSCASKTLKHYEQLVDRTDKIVIISQKLNDSLLITTDPILRNIKDILKRNIQPESPRKFIVDRSITLYEADKRIGILLISYGEKPYVNFRSDSLNFTFPLTYGIGMTLSELSHENSR